MPFERDEVPFNAIKHLLPVKKKHKISTNALKVPTITTFVA